MPVELRKRKAPPAPAPEPPARKKASKVQKAAAKVKEVVTGKSAKPEIEDKKVTSEAAVAGPPAVGDVLTLDDFGGEIETNDGTKTTLKTLIDESKAGVVLFTYPKASTPGCTNQACMFRDNYAPFTAGGLAIYGLSTDSPKANTTFKDKQKLPYPLLCDPKASLIAAIGLKKKPSGTQRGVFAIDKSGKVLLSEPGGPAATVAAVKKLVESQGASPVEAEAVAQVVSGAQEDEPKADAPAADAGVAPVPEANGEEKKVEA